MSDRPNARIDMDHPEHRKAYVGILRRQAQRFLKRNAAGTECCRESPRLPTLPNDHPTVQGAQLLATMRVDQPLPLRAARELLAAGPRSSGPEVMLNYLDAMLGPDDGGNDWEPPVDTPPPARRELMYRSAPDTVGKLTRTLMLTELRKAGKEWTGTAATEAPVYMPQLGEYEVLRMDGADLSQLTGGPIVDTHDTTTATRTIGSIGRAWVEGDRLKIGFSFAGTPRAQEIEQLVTEGHLRGLSVGYSVQRYKPATRAGKSVVEAVAWTPGEVSVVAIGADSEAGIGRSLTEPPLTEHRATPAHNTPLRGTMSNEPAVDPNAPADPNQLRAIARDFKLGDDVASQWIAEAYSLARAHAAVNVAEQRRYKQTPTPSSGADLTPREEQSFSFSKAILAVADGSWATRGGLEREVSDTIAKQRGTPPRRGGIYAPLNIRTSIVGNLAGTSSLGGAAVQTTIMSLIDLLRNKLVVRRAGAQFIAGLSSNISFPRQITANTFAWVGEDPSTATAQTALTMDNVTASPKTGMAASGFSYNMLVQSSVDAQALVANDLANIVARGIDDAAINGLGSGNAPKGIRKYSGIGNRTLGANGAALAWSDLVGLETDVAVANADGNGLAYVCNAAVRGKLKQTLATTVAGSAFLWETDTSGIADGIVNGRRAYVSNVVPSNLTMGTSTTICSSIICADWSSLMVCEFGNSFELVIDPYSQAQRGMILVTALTLADVVLRHPESVSISDAVLTT